jgi:hypothetical protein
LSDVRRNDDMQRTALRAAVDAWRSPHKRGDRV